MQQEKSIVKFWREKLKMHKKMLAEPLSFLRLIIKIYRN
jgi:hypothetical protein